MEVRAEPASVCVNRETPEQVLVCFEEGPPVLLDLSKGTSRPVPCIPVGQPPPERVPRQLTFTHVQLPGNKVLALLSHSGMRRINSKWPAWPCASCATLEPCLAS